MKGNTLHSKVLPFTKSSVTFHHAKGNRSMCHLIPCVCYTCKGFPFSGVRRLISFEVSPFCFC